MSAADDRDRWVVVCANGTEHRDYGLGEVSVAVSEQAGRDAAAFMDEDRDSSPWDCGPHSCRPVAAAVEGTTTTKGSD